MQREMPFISACSSPKLVPDELVKQCRHRLDAIRLCIHLSNLSSEVVAEQLGIDKGHFSRIMQGKAWFPDTKTVELMNLCCNLAPMQYEAMAMGYELFKDTKAQRKAELLAELEALEKAA